METALLVLLATLAPGGIIVTLIQKTRSENNRDHRSNAGKLDRLAEQLDRHDYKLDKLGDKLADHLEDHP
jgi:hypothetical protein